MKWLGAGNGYRIYPLFWTAMLCLAGARVDFSFPEKPIPPLLCPICAIFNA